MNPVESEAVVADALRYFGPDVLELIDASNELPLLKRRPFLCSWKVKDTAASSTEATLVDEKTGADAKEAANTKDKETQTADPEMSTDQNEPNGRNEHHWNGENVVDIDDTVGERPIVSTNLDNGLQSLMKWSVEGKESSVLCFHRLPRKWTPAFFRCSDVYGFFRWIRTLAHFSSQCLSRRRLPRPILY
jgi:hypothetical protein